MRDINVVKKELQKAIEQLNSVDESDLVKVEVYKSKVERLQTELEKIERGPRIISSVEGLPKGKFKKRNPKIINGSRFSV